VFENLAGVVLLFLALVVLLNVAKGTLGAWLRAKFLNQKAG
jgi:hypothetical protein